MSMFVLLNIIFVLFDYSTAQTEKVTLTWKNCTSANALGTIYNVTFDPKEPAVGVNYTITGVGATTIDLGYDAFYTLSVVAEGMPVGSIKDNACNASYLDLDGDYGRIYYNGMPCPISKGVFAISQIGWTNPNAPYFSGLSATATFNAYYKNSTESIACMQVIETFN
eukprot:224899_1